MYLSRVLLNTDRRETMIALASPNLLHGAVETSFRTKGETRQRNLWRIDVLRDKHYLMLLSYERPELLHIAAQFGYGEHEGAWDTKDYRPFLKRLCVGDVWQFRLQANPTRSAKNPDNSLERGKVLAHVTHEQQRQWLLQRAESKGFVLDDSSFDVVHSEWKKFPKSSQHKHLVTLRTAVYEGVLTIADIDLFRQSLVNGIGRGKAYGCGLLTIARQRSY